MPSPRSRTVRSLNALPREGSLAERIYGDLRQRLQRGQVGADERLVDHDLAAAYGTSRMPAREALLRLVAEGHLVGTTRGFAVPRLALQDVQDIFEVRRLLEPHAAADAARHLDDVAAAALRGALQRARDAVAAGRADELALANAAFRRAWMGCVANRRLADTIDRFADQVQAVRLTTLGDPAVREVVLQGLEELADALLARDPVRTRKTLAAFNSAAQDAFVAAQLAARGTPPAATRPPLRRRARTRARAAR